MQQVTNSGFLKTFMGELGVGEQQVWQNNNGNLQQNAYIAEGNLTTLAPSILRKLYDHNKSSGEPALTAVPVAGYTPKESAAGGLFACWTEKGRQERLDQEYAKSFSVAPFTTASQADVILRMSEATQRMEIFTEGGEAFLRVTGGVRVTDADRFVEKAGYALRPCKPTLHVASLAGAAANGCYGPALNYGPMTTQIVAMKIFNALGEPLTLSEKENTHLFRVLRDCHMGACVVDELTFRIEKKFNMERKHILLQDAAAFKTATLKENLLAEEHFVFMYIPVDIEKQGNHDPRIRVTTMKRTDKRPGLVHKCRAQSNLDSFFKLQLTETGEPLINAVVRSEKLRKFFPFILDLAASQTYGKKRETLEVGNSAEILHLLKTYTDLPIAVINPLIQVSSLEEARDLLVELTELTEGKCKEYAGNKEYPLLNSFARVNLGVFDPDGEGGVAPTATDEPDQFILSFEFVTYEPLDSTPAFKDLVQTVIDFLNKKKLKFKFHPGKTWPEGYRSLPQIFCDAIDQKRLDNFQKAVLELNGGEDNIQFSPLLTEQKKEFFGFAPLSEAAREERKKPRLCSDAQEQLALHALIKLAEQKGDKQVAAECQELIKI